MKFNLPSVDERVKVTAENSEKLDEIRKLTKESLIESATARCRRRVRGIQYQVDMELRRPQSPIDGCIRTSSLTNNSLWQLNSTLNKTIGALSDTPSHTSKDFEMGKSNCMTAKILVFETYS